MSERLAWDSAWTHVDPSRAQGYEGALRYCSSSDPNKDGSGDSPGKDITAAEVALLHAAGKWVATMWETTAERALQGYDAGKFDAQRHNSKLDAIGCPATVAVFWTCDTDPSGRLSQIAPYAHGFHDGSKRPKGPYGGFDLVEWCAANAVADVFWQTQAWSGSKVSTHAHLYQRVKPTVGIPGYSPSDYDENLILKDFAWWGPHGVGPSPHPQPITWTEVANVKMTVVQVPTDGHGSGSVDLGSTSRPLAYTTDLDVRYHPTLNISAPKLANGHYSIVMVGAPANGHIGVQVTVAD